jgi:hypothetical protein
MSMKNPNDTIGNRTRDLPACSAVPQPTAPSRTPLLMVAFLNSCLQTQYGDSANIFVVNYTSAMYSYLELQVFWLIDILREGLCSSVVVFVSKAWNINSGNYYETLRNNHFH